MKKCLQYLQGAAVVVALAVMVQGVVYADTPDSDGDGVPDMSDRCPNEPGPLQGCPANSEFCEAMENADMVGMGIAMGGLWIMAAGVPAGPAVSLLGLGMSLLAKIGEEVADC